jgi:hypothetical protein
VGPEGDEVLHYFVLEVGAGVGVGYFALVVEDGLPLVGLKEGGGARKEKEGERRRKEEKGAERRRKEEEEGERRRKEKGGKGEERRRKEEKGAERSRKEETGGGERSYFPTELVKAHWRG